MSEIYDPQALLEEIESLEAGKPRLMGIRRAIEEADRAKDEDHSFIFRYEYVKESTFDGDHYDSILMFPELLAKFDAMEERGHKFAYMMLGAYEWILQDGICFYQISAQAFDDYFDDYRRRAMQFGKSAHMYLLLCMERLRHGFADRISGIMKFFREITYNGMTLYQAHESVKYELFSGNFELAQRYAEIVFREGEKASEGEVPGKTYGYFMEYYYHRGEYEKAAKYADKMLPHIKNGNTFFFDEYFSLAVDTFRITDNARAYELWKKYNPSYLECKNPALRFFWDAVSHRLFNESDPNLSKKYYEAAKELGEKFDKRNGNSFYLDFLNREI